MSWEVFDQVAWSVLVALLVGALYFSRNKPRAWTFDGLLGVLRGESVPGVDVLDWLGAGVSWEELREWSQGSGACSEGLERILKRRFGEVVGLWLEPAKFRMELLDTIEFSPGELTPDREKVLAEKLGERRVVALATAESQGMLELLRGAPGLRDRLVAVVILGGAGVDGEWLKREFTHENFDLERMQVVPYFWHGEGAPETPLLPRSGRASVEMVPIRAGTRELVLLLAGIC